MRLNHQTGLCSGQQPESFTLCVFFSVSKYYTTHEPQLQFNGGAKSVTSNCCRGYWTDTESESEFIEAADCQFPHQSNLYLLLTVEAL